MLKMINRALKCTKCGFDFGEVEFAENLNANAVLCGQCYCEELAKKEANFQLLDVDLWDPIFPLELIEQAAEAAE